MNNIYTADDSDVTLTIIARDRDEATGIAACALDWSLDEVTVRLAEPVPGRRWLRYEYNTDADNIVRELLAHGVDRGDIHIRAATDGYGDDMYSEVGATDAHWCRLPPQLLWGTA